MFTHNQIIASDWRPILISVRTTEFRGADSVGRTFESNMFSRTNAFALSDEKGRIRVDTAELRLGGPKVSRVQSTGHVVDLTEETAATMLFPSSGQLRVRVSAAEFRISPKAVCLFGPNARRTRAEAPPDAGLFQANALIISNRALRDLVQASLNHDKRWPGLPDSMPIFAALPEVRRLSDLLDFITRQFDADLPLSDRAAAAMAVLIEEFLSEIITRSMYIQTEERVLSAARERVRMAEEILRARSDEPLSMRAVAREVGVGLRSLQLAFVEVRAMGPRDVLLQMRLERARKRLLSVAPSETVTSIALDCGFAHLGRFPAAYRAAFNELPAETLTRSRRRLS